MSEIMENSAVEMNPRVKEILDQTHLNWKVRTEALQTESGIVLPSNVALVRDDTNTVLSVRGNGYHPYQNSQLIELLDRVSNQIGLPIHTGGYFGNGEKVYIQLKSNDLKLGNDRIEGYLTGVNSFDGSTSLAFGPSNLTISCRNTFFAAFRELNTKVRHTKNMVIKIDEICYGLERVLDEEKVLFEDIKQLSDIRMTQKDEDWVTRLLFNLSKDIDLKDEDAVSTVTRNKLTRFYVDLNGELKQKGDSLWGLFSGVTKFTTHSLTGDSTENKLFNVYGQRERKIFSELVAEHV